MEKRALVILWDRDAGRNPQYMGSIEISLQGLLDAVKSGSALQLRPPPKDKLDDTEKDAGRLYVEVASVGYPQVRLCPLYG